MSIFYLVHGSGGDFVASYDGMDAETVERLLSESNLTFESVSDKEYESFLRDHPPVLPVVPDLSQAKATLRSRSASASDRLDAVVTILGL